MPLSPGEKIDKIVSLFTRSDKPKPKYSLSLLINDPSVNPERFSAWSLAVHWHGAVTGKTLYVKRVEDHWLKEIADHDNVFAGAEGHMLVWPPTHFNWSQRKANEVIEIIKHTPNLPDNGTSPQFVVAALQRLEDQDYIPKGKTQQFRDVLGASAVDVCRTDPGNFTWEGEKTVSEHSGRGAV